MGFWRVNATEIDHEFIIDEYPYVIIAAEGEALAWRVDEIRMALGAKIAVS
jgi:hypothetical protein